MFDRSANRKNFRAAFARRGRAHFPAMNNGWRAVLRCMFVVTIMQLPVSAQAGERKPVYFYAAASMQGALAKVLALAVEELSLEIVPVYGGSAGLARQIAQGAPAALFLSANTDWVDYLSDTFPDLISDQQPLLRNKLVFVASPCRRDWRAAEPAPAAAPALRKTILAALETGEKIAIGMPESVPAGGYARQALQALGLWDAARRQAVYSENVTVALNWVANCDAAFGFVYESDAQAGRKLGVRHVALIPAALHQPIIYPLAYMNGPHTKDAQRLGAFLKSPQAARIFLSHGFALAD